MLYEQYCYLKAIMLSVSFLFMLIMGVNLVLCNEYYIISTQGNCSVESCLTLSQFANNTASYTDSGNTTLFITANKNHTLKKVITVSNTSLFSLLPSVMNKQDMFSVVICNEDAGFTFYNSSSVLIRGLIFMGCSISMFGTVSQLTIQHSIFNGQNKENTSMLITNSTANITDTLFISNTAGSRVENVSPQPPSSLSTISTVGGALIINSSNLTLKSCVFDGNKANIGGAIFSESNSSVTLRNSIFISNHAKDCDSGLCYGGALFVDKSGRVVIDSCNFTHNSADVGGVLSLVKSSASITNTEFSNNKANESGGVIYAEDNTSMRVQNGTFISNSARYGGVMRIVSNEVMAVNTVSEVVIYSSWFSDNFASKDGAVIISDGNNLAFIESTFDKNRANDDGGVVYTRNNCTTEFTSCLFTNNRVGDSGGAVYGRDYCTITITNTIINNCRANDSGGGVYIRENGMASIYNSTFTNNSADYGGAVRAWRTSDVNIDSTTFLNNRADTDGGSLYIQIQCNLTIQSCFFVRNRAINNGNIFVADSSNLELESTHFTDNMAGNDGGAVYLYDSSAMIILDCNISYSVSGDSGGALYGRRNTNMTITNCMIDSNRAENSGGGVYAQQDSFLTIENCVFNNNVAEYGGAIRVYIESFADIYGSSFTGNSVSISGGAVAVYKESITIVKDSTFMENIAGFGSAMVAYSSNITVDNSTVCSNRAQLGGAIRVLEANVILSMCTFRNNRAFSDGGVLYADNSLAVIDTCTFNENIADHNGGVAYYASTSQLIVNNTSFDRNIARYDGGVIYTSGKSNTSIDGGVFSRNSAENSGGVIGLLGQSNIFITSSNFTQSIAVDAGGVISSLQQSKVSICSSTFTNSSTNASSGGVLHVHNGTLVLRDSNFTHNRAQENGGVISAHQSSVLTIVCSTFDSNIANAGCGGALYLTQGSNSSIVNSIFEESTAKESGGAISLSASSKLDATKSLFSCSTAQVGAALAAIQNSHISFKDQELLSEQCNFNIDEVTVVCHNKAELNGSIYLSDGSALFIGEETNISHNNASMFGGGIYAINSIITVGSTQVNFNNNNAKYGGGLCLANSNVHAVTDKDLDYTNSVINFLLNKAEYSGGAMYVDDDSNSSAMCSTNSNLIADNAPTCFFQDTAGGLMINLSRNDAKRGQDLYGGLLDRCTVADSEGTNSSKKDELAGKYHFLSISSIESFHTVSSKAVRVCLCNDRDQPNCAQTTDYLQIKRGKINTFTLTLAAVDQVHHSVPATITSSFNDDSVSSSQTMRANSTNCSNVEFQVSFPKVSKNYTLNIFAEGPCTDRGTSDFSVEITVMDCICPPGFMLQENSTACSCICDKKLSELIETLECNVADKSIIREGEYWLTFLGDNSSSDNSNSPYSYFVYPHCPYDYCKPPTMPTSINLSEPEGSDAQCIDNRGGLLCGRCQPNYSLSLGSSKCIKCPTNWNRYGLPIGIVVAALIAGIALIVSILVFNLTVTVGTLNSIIFYANIIDVNRSIYFRQLHLTFIPVFISWLNLDIGFDACFIEGMDTYYKIWLRLAFPAYIIFIVIAIIWISSCSSKFSNLIGKKDPVATLATLILLSYTKLLQTVIVSFSFVFLNYPNETSSTLRWLPDASIEFAAGKHIALICVAILILMLGIAYTFLIFSWRWLRECKGCKWAKNQRLHSFIDTYHIPHTMKHRYWTGLLLLVRIIVYILSAFSVSTDPRITFLSIIAIMSCLFLYKTTFIIRVYKNWLLNAMDSFVYFNILIFTAFTWFTQDDLHSETKKILQIVISYISGGTIVILTLLIIIYHVYRYGNDKLYSIGQNTKLAKKISANMSEDNTQKDIWSRSRGTYKLFSALDDPRESSYSGYVPPPPMKATASTISMEDCDEALTSDAQHHVGKSSKKKRRAKTDTPKGGLSKTGLKEFALLRKTESKFPFHKENAIASGLLDEDNEL